MTEVEVAWAAGLFEGEGSLGLYVKAGRSYASPTMALSMTDEDVVRRFQAAIGVGRVRPLKPQKVYYKVQWRWQINSWPDVLHTLNLLMPFMGARRAAVAQTILDYHRERRCPSVQ